MASVHRAAPAQARRAEHQGRSRRAVAGLVMAVFTELQQVVLNFAINAEQAIVHADSPRRQHRDPHRRSRRLGVDRGRGHRPRRARRSTKPSCSSRSTRPSRSARAPGLGLSVSYDIIRSHGGRIGYRRGAIAAARSSTSSCRSSRPSQLDAMTERAVLHRAVSRDRSTPRSSRVESVGRAHCT